MTDIKGVIQEGVWRISGRGLEGVWKVSKKTLDISRKIVWKLPGKCLKVCSAFLKSSWKGPGSCLNGLLKHICAQIFYIFY